jgi:hypothetical protein
VRLALNLEPASLHKSTRIQSWVGSQSPFRKVSPVSRGSDVAVIDKHRHRHTISTAASAILEWRLHSLELFWNQPYSSCDLASRTVCGGSLAALSGGRGRDRIQRFAGNACTGHRAPALVSLGICSLLSVNLPSFFTAPTLRSTRSEHDTARTAYTAHAGKHSLHTSLSP